VTASPPSPGAAPLASVVVPALDEGDRLAGLLDGLAAAAPPGAPDVEFVVVDDGSAHRHLALERAAVAAASGRALASGAPCRFRLVEHLSNRGKGAAIRRGWGEASGGAAWLGFLDADGAVPAAEAWRLAGRLLPDPGFDVLAATRIRMAGRTIRRSRFRHAQGRVFATLAERLFRLGFYDTQCGLKLFRASLLHPVLPLLREDRWLLDVEVLALLQRRGARCVEEPIDWADPGRSKVVPFLDPLKMLAGLLSLRRRLGPPPAR
jgi:dolichyl-phosphate beta-glucosyltransferase